MRRQAYPVLSLSKDQGERAWAQRPHRAAAALKHLQLAETAADDVRHRAAGLVRVAAPQVLASAILPWAIRAYADERPKVQVRIRDAPVELLVDRVASGEADLAIGPDRVAGDEVQRITPIDIVDDITTALGIAAANVAATLAPLYVDALAAPFGLVMRRIVEPEVMRQVCLYRPAQRASLPAAEGFAEFLADWMRSWATSHA